MHRKRALFILAWVCIPAMAFAQPATRDADIDLKMNADALSSVAPPTGSQALPVAPASNSQRFVDPYLPAALQGGGVVMGQTDGQGRVYEVKGDVKRSASGSPVEKKLKKNDAVRAGDKIITGADSAVSITFDENYLNAAHIPADTQAIIESIEPTHIRLENGSVFNAIDGLPQGSTWKVSTTAVVAAVRGTLYLVRFQAADGRFLSATVNVPDDGKDSAVDIREITGNAAAVVPEGKQIVLKQGQSPDSSLVTDLDPSILEQILKFFEDLLKLREENSRLVAPPTSGQFSGPGVLDSAGPGVIGGNDNRQFDPFELGTIQSNSGTTDGSDDSTPSGEVGTGTGEGYGTGDGFGEGSGDGYGSGTGDDGGDGYGKCENERERDDDWGDDHGGRHDRDWDDDRRDEDDRDRDHDRRDEDDRDRDRDHDRHDDNDRDRDHDEDRNEDRDRDNDRNRRNHDD